jgi:arylsulfatase A-like enzyme
MDGTKRYLDEMTGHGPFRVREEGKRPNILLISADMVPVEFYLPGAAGMNTPNLQALRDRHLYFANAYCTSPLCAPSRAAYLSGRHSYITTNSERAHDGHEVHLRDDDVLFPEYLKAVGYHARHVGKSHVGTHKFTDIFSENDAPWNRWSPPWFDDDAYVRFLQEKGLGRISFEREIIGRGLTGEGKGNSYGGWVAEQGGKGFPKEATYPAFLVERTIEAFEARSDEEQPFYMQLDFFGPHQPFAIPAGMEEREREIRAEMELPESYRELAENGFAPPGVESRVYQIYRKNWGLQDPETVVDYRVANQLQFELIDEMIGRLFAYLKEQGLYEEIWIFFIADHGEMNGERGLVDKGAYLNPRVIRVPLMVKPAEGSEWADVRKSVEQPVSLLDLAPTMLDIAGISTEARLDGVSLLEAARGEKRPEEQPIFFEVWSHVIPNPCIGTVFTAADGRDYMFSFNATDEVDELYALGDEGRLVNLWDDKESVTILDEAVARLHARLARDERWKSYRGFLELTYPEKLAASGDRQLFF